MPLRSYSKYFKPAIQWYFPIESVSIMATTDIHYKAISKDTDFASSSSNPIDRRLDFCAYFLALIKTLDEKGASFEIIRTVCVEIVSNYVKPRNALHAYTKKLIPRLINTRLGLILIQSFHKRINSLGNIDGFRANIITDKNQTYGLGYGVDILECGICKLFAKHNFQKYSSILCEVDEITSGLAGLKLIRTGTIAHGASKCDFRYERINSQLKTK